MYSIILLSIYVIFYPKIRINPNGGPARFLRKGLPVILIGVVGYFIVEKFKYGYVPTLERLNPLMVISLIQGYAALWFIHVLTSITWILSRQNSSPWITLPWQKVSSKLMGLVWNGFLCVGLVRFLAIHMVVVAFIVWVYFKLKSKRTRSTARQIE